MKYEIVEIPKICKNKKFIFILH